MSNRDYDEVYIRTACYQDAAQLAKIEALCFPAEEAASLKSIGERLKAFPNHFYVACIGETIIGFVNGCVSDSSCIKDEMYENTDTHKEDGMYQTVFGLDVLSEFRGHGIAHSLMERLIEESKNEGRKAVVLTCKENLIGFYETMGFVNYGMSASAHGRAVWYDMKLML